MKTISLFLLQFLLVPLSFSYTDSYTMGLIAMQEGQFRIAENHFHAALQQEPKNLHILNVLATCYTKQKNI